MPKTAVDVDDFAEAREDHVRRAGQRLDVKAEAKAETMGESAHEQFRGRVFGLYQRHDPRTLDFANAVRHSLFRFWEQSRAFLV